MKIKSITNIVKNLISLNNFYYLSKNIINYLSENLSSFI